MGGGRRKRLIDCDEHLADGEFIEAAAIAIESAFAALTLTGQAGQRILHQPHIAASLNRSGRRPGLSQAADRPWAPYARISRAVERNRWAASSGRQMRDGGIGSDIQASA